MLKKTLILTGGKLSKSFLSAFLEGKYYDDVIIVDGAINWIEMLSIRPNILVGDFDTAGQARMCEIAKKYRVPVEQHVPEKNETDTELALSLALERGASQIDVLGATGRRIDHFLGTVSTLLKPLEKQIDCTLYDEYNKIRLLNHSTVFLRTESWGKYISFLPFTEQVTNVDLIGFRYPLQKATFTWGNTLGISNELAGEQAEVNFDTGILICIESDDVPYEKRKRNG